MQIALNTPPTRPAGVIARHGAGGADDAAVNPLAHYQIIRRNGAVVPFEPNKIAVAMMKAFLAVHGTQGAASASVREMVDGLTQAVIRALMRSRPGGGTFHIEDVQDQVELGLMRGGHHEIARAYVLYREKRTQERAKKVTQEAPKAPQLHALDGGQRIVLDLARLKAMDADVHYSAARVTHVQQVPLDRINVHVLLQSGVLQLDPMDLGVAGGSLDGRVRIDANSNPALAQVRLDVRGLELNRLFPGIKLTQASFGKVHGNIDLRGRGNSVAQMLGAASGSVAAVMGRGEISNLLLEYVGLDGGEIIKFLLIGDRNVRIRCAAAAFGVDHGLMSSRALLLDTDDTVIHGDGQVSLAEESLSLTLRPYPKDMSILALRSPLKVTGAFIAPHVGPDKGAVAGRAGLALALAAINPLLALAATVETGPGKDADCGAALHDAASPAAVARIAATPGRIAAAPRPARPRASGPRQ